MTTRASQTQSFGGRASDPPSDGSGRPRFGVVAAYPAVVAGLTVVVLGVDHGGTGRGAWALATLSLGAMGAALLAGWARPSRAALAWVGLLGALTAWTALSALWSAAPGTALAEASRTLLYLGAAAVIAFAAREGLRWVPHALMVAITAICLDCLALRIFPGFPGQGAYLGYGRLYEPLGYWNALGIIAAMGGLVALQIATSPDQHRAWRIAASTTLPVTLPVMYLTFSRGAVIAFAAGVVVSALVARRRIDWTVCAVANAIPPGLVIAITAHQTGLVSGNTTPGQGGGALAAALLLGVASAVAVAMALDARPGSIRVARLSRRAALSVTVTLAVLGSIGLVAAVGSPATAVHRASSAFRREIWFGRDLHGNLNNRYLELSLSGRVGLWDGALELAGGHPVVGAGAGSFGAYWGSLDRYPHDTREALSLYLETLAELGAVGLVLLGGAVLLPLWTAVRTRSQADLVLGAFVAFALHAAQDMDWEWPAVTVIGVICGGLLVRSVGSAVVSVRLPPAARWALGGACLLLAVISLVAAVAATGHG